MDVDGALVEVVGFALPGADHPRTVVVYDPLLTNQERHTHLFENADFNRGKPSQLSRALPDEEPVVELLQSQWQRPCELFGQAPRVRHDPDHTGASEQYSGAALGLAPEI